MTQATYVPNIAHDNAEALAFFQNVLAAIATNNLGPTAPTETYAGMWWVDTSGGGFVVKQRNAANSAWVVFAPPNLTPEQAEDPLGNVFGLASGEILAGAVAAFATSPAEYVYDYQEFIASGTWTKPANAESGDKVVVHVVGGGGGGALGGGGVSPAAGGQGGGGAYLSFDVDDLPSSAPVVVGAAGLGSVGLGDGADGGNSSIGTGGNAVGGVAPFFVWAEGGARGLRNNDNSDGKGRVAFGRTNNEQINTAGITTAYLGGFGGGSNNAGGSSVYGGGGGGGTDSNNGSQGGFSALAGRGGQGTETTGSNIAAFDIDGEFPGGGGGGADTDVGGSVPRGGNGAAGVVRVWCIKES